MVQLSEPNRFNHSPRSYRFNNRLSKIAFFVHKADVTGIMPPRPHDDICGPLLLSIALHGPWALVDYFT